PEDLTRYEPRELAALAEEAWAFLKERKPGTPKVRLESRPGPIGAEHIKTVSIVEIVNDDMPFLLDSIMNELTELGVEVRLVVHPIFTVERDNAGTLIGFRGDAAAVGAAQRESFIHIYVERIEDELRRTQVVRALELVLADVRVVAQDWRPMTTRVGELTADIPTHPPHLTVDEVAEAVQFLEWLVANNFTLLGLREYAFPGAEREVEPKDETGAGTLGRQ